MSGTVGKKEFGHLEDLLFDHAKEQETKLEIVLLQRGFPVVLLLSRSVQLQYLQGDIARS